MDKIFAPIKQRILQFIEYKGINKKIFFEEIDISSSNFRSKSLYSEVGGDVIAKISSKFKDVNINWLISGDGEMIISEKQYQNNYQNVDNKVAESNNNYASPKVISCDHKGNENIVHVPVKARGGYLHGYGDTEFIETLPSYNLPGLNGATYRSFEVEGVSMYPTLKPQDYVVAEWIPKLEDIRENRVHVIVTNDGILVKRVVNRIKERGKLYLKSDTLKDRPYYPTIELDPQEIREIWYVKMKFSADLSAPDDLYSRMNDLEIIVNDIKKEFHNLGAK